MKRTLASRLMSRFVACMVALTILAIPLLYLITTRYYAEDLADLVMRYGVRNPDIDLERDTMVGLFIQFSAIIVILLVAVMLVMRYVPKRLWRPFNDILEEAKGFRVEEGIVPKFKPTGTKEFDELEQALTSIMTDSVKSYNVQKEFTENASHELQTPIAIVQGRLDNILQDPALTERQAVAIQQIYQEIRLMSRLSRNLLLLSKIENNQYHKLDRVNIPDKISALLPNLESLAGDIAIETDLRDRQLTVDCNETLLESMLNNLIVNAVRHNRPNGKIAITLNQHRLVVANPSDEPPLDASRIFSRFYRVKASQKGNGLGLAIVKSICDYHHWDILYRHEGGQHQFIVVFPASSPDQARENPQAGGQPCDSMKKSKKE